MYAALKKILFTLNAETSHHLTLRSLQLAYQLGITQQLYKQFADPVTVMGLNFPNRVGLAAGLDKNADFVDALASLGFGFLEVGTITPKPQAGNPKPRLFRIIEQEAIINRMGFNNQGVEYACGRLQAMKYRGIIGVNIGKNRDTPIEKAINDYSFCFNLLMPYASYFTINISSPNTEGLRSLQHGELFSSLLRKLKQQQLLQNRYVPLVVKIAPDLTMDELTNIAQIISSEKMDGVIATNTTLQRPGVNSTEAGGLSGAPLFKLSTDILVQLRKLLPREIPIIASGGIMDVTTARAKINAGASLLQIYTGLIYRGPKLINDIVRGLH